MPGKDISPYDGRPASWWRESAGDGKAGRRAEGGADAGECGSGGVIAEGCSGAAVERGRETPAGGTRSVPATLKEEGRGWDSVVVEESDVVACGGYLPERCIAIAGGGDSEAETVAGLEDEVPQREAKSSDPQEGETNLERVGERAEGGDLGCDEGVGDGAGDWSTPVDRECPATATQEGGSAGKTAEKCENEANLCDAVHIVQPQDVVDVPANSGGVSEVDGCQTKPIFLETKPISAGGAEAGGSGGSTAPKGRPLTEREQWEAWREIRRREWIRSRAEKEARERGRLARLNSGVWNAAAESGGAAGSQDVRGP